MEDAEVPFRGTAEVLSVLLRLLNLIFGCVSSIAKSNLKLGVSIASFKGKYLVDVVTVVTLVLFLLYATCITAIQQKH